MSNGFKHALSILVSIALFALSIILVVTLDKPQVDVVIQTRSSIRDLQHDLTAQQQIVESAKKILDRYKNMAAITDVFNGVLPSVIDNAGLLSNLIGLAGSSGLQVKSLDFTPGTISPPPLETAKTKGYGTINMNITAEGAYPAFFSFLQKLEVNERLFDLQDLRVSQGSKPDILNFQASFTTYYQSH